MRIHNFYSDLLMSLRYLFDNIIFESGTIQSYEFNIGNKSLQVKHESQYTLPAVIINYQTTRATAYHPSTFQRYSGRNAFKTPVLFNKTKNIELLLQEELFETTIDVFINCESALQGLEFELQIQNRAPINKYFQFYRFTSFLEIDKEYLDAKIFNTNYDEIINLFTKHNRITDKIDYCFGIEYEPLIRFDNIALQVGSSDQRSFPVSCTLTILNPTPIYLEIPLDQKPDKIIKSPVRYFSRNNIIVPSTDSTSATLLLKINRTQQFIYVDHTLGDFTSTFEYNSNEYTITGVLDKEEIEASGTLTLNNKQINTSITIVNDLVNNTLESVTLSGTIGGVLSYPKVTDNSITGGLSTIYDNKLIYTNVSIDDYSIIKRTKNLLNYDITPALPNLTSIIALSYDNIYNTNLDLNKNLINIKTLLITKVIIKKIGLYLDSYYQIDTNIATTISNNIASFTSSFIVTEITITISGQYNLRTGKFTAELSYSDEPNTYELVATINTLELISDNPYGQRNIEKIELSVNDLSDSTISTVPLSIFNNPEDPIKRLIRTSIIDNSDITRNNNKFNIVIYFDESIGDLNNLSNIYWRFLFDKSFITSSDDNLFTLVTTNTYSLEFEIDYDKFIKYYLAISTDNLLYFQLYQLI